MTLLEVGGQDGTSEDTVNTKENEMQNQLWRLLRALLPFLKREGEGVRFSKRKLVAASVALGGLLVATFPDVAAFAGLNFEDGGQAIYYILGFLGLERSIARDDEHER